MVLKCKSCINIRILRKLFIGVLLVFIFEVGCLTLDIYSTLTITNHNDTCSLFSNEVNLIDGELHADYKLLFAKQLFTGVALYIFFTSILEFICAQSPYSMKGLLIGMTYFLGTISITLSLGFMKVFQILTKTSGERCGTWFYLSNICVTFVSICILVIIMKFYKFRKRDETLSNDQMFAVDYFSKYLSSQSPHAHNSE